MQTGFSICSFRGSSCLRGPAQCDYWIRALRSKRYRDAAVVCVILLDLSKATVLQTMKPMHLNGYLLSSNGRFYWIFVLAADLVRTDVTEGNGGKE